MGCLSWRAGLVLYGIYWSPIKVAYVMVSTSANLEFLIAFGSAWHFSSTLPAVVKLAHVHSQVSVFGFLNL